VKVSQILKYHSSSSILTDQPAFPCDNKICELRFQKTDNFLFCSIHIAAVAVFVVADVDVVVVELFTTPTVIDDL